VDLCVMKLGCQPRRKNESGAIGFRGDLGKRYAVNNTKGIAIA
jgi:hypothetical protein